MTLKIGDIKGIEVRGRKLACVVVGKRHTYLNVVTIQGETITIDEKTPYSIVRLEPGVRATFERIGKEAKEIDKRKKAIEKLNSEINKIEKRITQDKEKIQEQTGYLTGEEFMNVMYKALNPSTQRRIEKYLSNGYVQENATEVIIRLSRDEDIQKYAQPHQYDFIEAEYDGTFHIYGTRTKQYTDLVKQYSRQDAEVEGTKGISVKQYRGLSLGDKNWLTYGHEQEIRVKTKEGLTKDLAIKIGQAIKLK